MKRLQLMTVDKPRCDIQCGGQVLSSSIIYNAGRNPNFPDNVRFLEVVSTLAIKTAGTFLEKPIGVDSDCRTSPNVSLGRILAQAIEIHKVREAFDSSVILSFVTLSCWPSALYYHQDLPENEHYCPPLTIRVVDCRQFGRFTLVGTHTVSNLASYKMDTKKLESQAHTLPTAGKAGLYEPKGW